MDNFKHFYPDVKDKGDIQKLLYNIKKISRDEKVDFSTKKLDTSAFPKELKEKFDDLEKLESLSDA